MKTFGLMAFSLLVSLYCSSQKLKITLYNRTGYNLDSVYWGKTFLGSIANDSSKAILDWDRLMIENSLPLGYGPKGKISDKTKIEDKTFFSICVDEAHTVSSGNFEWDIVFKETEKGYQLWWNWHKALRITLYNKTGYDLDSVYLGRKMVGSIGANSQILITNIDSIYIQGGLPYGVLTDGVFRDKTKIMSNELLGMSDGGAYYQETGDLEFDIITQTDDEGNYMLSWKKHNKK